MFYIMYWITNIEEYNIRRSKGLKGNDFDTILSYLITVEVAEVIFLKGL